MKTPGDHNCRVPESWAGAGIRLAFSALFIPGGNGCSRLQSHLHVSSGTGSDLLRQAADVPVLHPWNALDIWCGETQLKW